MKSSSVKVFFIVVLALQAVNGWGQAADRAAGKKVAMIIPFKRYSVEEFRIPKGILEKAGIKVTVVSSQPGTAVMGNDQAAVDVVIDRLKVTDYDAIVFVGGYGTPEYIDDQTAHAVAREAVKENKLLAAICWAPIILAKAGVLKGKKATASTDRSVIVANGGEFAFASVVVDGNIITGSGPAASEEFGRAILATLQKQKKK